MRRLFYFFVSLIICCSANAKDKAIKLNVGVMFRLDDKYNTTVNSLVEGIQLARDEFQQKNPRYEITLKPYSHNSDLASVMSVANKAVADGVPAIIGGEISDESLVMGEILNSSKVVLMTPTSSNPKVTLNRPYVFRGCFSDAQVASSMANFVLKQLKPIRIGLIHNVSSPYSDYLALHFLESIEKIQQPMRKSKIEVVISKVVRGTFDFDSITNDFAKKNVSHVIMLTHDSDLLRFTASAAKINYHPVFVGSDGWGSNEGVFKTFVQDSKTGSAFIAYRNSYWHQESSRAASVRFKKSFETKFKIQPTAWSAIGYDSAKILFNAMSKARDPRNGSEIQSALKVYKGSGFVTSNYIKFDESNSPTKDLVIYQIDKRGISYKEVLK